MKWNALETDSISLRIHLSIRQGVYKQIEFLNVWFILINKMNLFLIHILWMMSLDLNYRIWICRWESVSGRKSKYGYIGTWHKRANKRENNAFKKWNNKHFVFSLKTRYKHFCFSLKNWYKHFAFSWKMVELRWKYAIILPSKMKWGMRNDF